VTEGVIISSIKVRFGDGKGNDKIAPTKENDRAAEDETRKANGG